VERFIAHKVRMNQYSRASAHTKHLALLKFCGWFSSEAALASITSRQLAAFYEHDREPTAVAPHSFTRGGLIE